MNDWNLGFVAERLQRAAFDPALWPDALQDLSRTVGGAGASIFSGRARPRRELASPDLLEVIDDYVLGGWREHDDRKRAVAIGLARGVVVDQDYITPQEMRRSAFYEDFLSRYGLRWSIGLRLDLGPQGVGSWGVSIHRSAAQGPFLPHEVAVLHSFAPVIAGQATIAASLGHARVEGLTQALEVIGRPCLILDECGELMEANAAGDALLGRALDVVDGRLRFMEGTSQAAFDVAVAEALAETRSNLPRVLCVRDRTGVRHVLRVIHVGAVTRYPFASGFLLVMFEEDAPPERQTLATLKAAFGLTPSEARLCRALLAGRSVAAAAREGGLTYETARSYLKAIFLKTGTHRQAELIALLSRLRS